MANRVLRDYTRSEKVDLISSDAECLFIRLMTQADDYGTFHANPKIVKASCFPLKVFTDERINKLIGELTNSGLVIRFEVEGKPYLHIVDFGQRLRAMRNKFPRIPENLLVTQLDSNSRRIAADCGDSPPETKRNETETKQEPAISPTAVVVTSTNFSDKSIAMVEFVKTLKNVSKLKDQLTHEEADRLLDKFPKETLKEILLEMENYKLLTKKSNSVNLTIRSWLKRRSETLKRPHDINQNFNGITAN